MNRVDVIKQLMTNVISNVDNENFKRIGYSHLFGVSKFAALLAVAREFDENDVELLSISGLLHDIAMFVGLGRENHGQKGAEYLRELLPELEIFSDEETEKICAAIAVHSDKENISNQFNEVLKDADVMDHFYSDVSTVIGKEINRLKKLNEELNLKIEIEVDS